MKKKHPLRRVVLSTATTASGIAVLIALKPAAAPTTVHAGGADGQQPGSAVQASSRTLTATGRTVQTKYGPVQVRLTFTSGRITAATALQHPTGNPVSNRINAGAIPKLNQETLAAQSAHIAAVSGASYTSAGYKQSLQSALDQATRQVTGRTVQTKYGPVQVRLTSTGGRITAATALQHPTGNPVSNRINAGAIPKLNQETLAAQSADIAAVSGASYTSAGYKQSLQSALDQLSGSAPATAPRPTAGTPTAGTPTAARTSAAPTHSASPAAPVRSTSPAAPPRTTTSKPTATRTTAAPTTRTVTGTTVQTDYGPVQVQITLSGSRITAATALQYPTGASRSQQISSMAIPKLNQETLAAQSANIAAVSGASYTSAGYKQSLQSALDKAGV